MTRINIKDLPPKMREQLLAKDPVPTPPEGSKRATARPGPVRGSAGPGPAYRCKTCGTEFDHYGAAAERCADSHGGGRLDAILR